MSAKASPVIVPLICVSFLGYMLKWETLLIPWAGWVLFFCVTGFILVAKIRIPVFLLFSVWSYAVLGNLIPQQEFRQASFEDIERTPGAFIQTGEKIFFGKGKCSSCHTVGPGVKSRCPDILKASREAGMRKSSLTAREYLTESIYKPSAYVVAGYTAIMPEPWKPPISLSALEIEMVIAYIQSLSGEDVDVSPITPPVGTGRRFEREKTVVTGNSRNGKRVFESGKGKCLACHRVSGKGGEGDGEDSTGPDLTEIGALNTVEYIRESILFPNAKILKGYGVVDFRINGGMRVEGLLSAEDHESLTVKRGGEASRFLKESIVVRKVRSSQWGDISGKGYFWVRMDLSDGTKAEGSVLDETPQDIRVGNEKKSEVFQKRDILSLHGRRILRTSRMPGYDHVLTIREFNDLLSYLVTLKGTPPEG